MQNELPSTCIRYEIEMNFKHGTTNRRLFHYDRVNKAVQPQFTEEERNKPGFVQPPPVQDPVPEKYPEIFQFVVDDSPVCIYSLKYLIYKIFT